MRASLPMSVSEMNRLRLAIILLSAAWAEGFRSVTAAADLQCAVCRARIQGEFYWIATPALAEKQSICEPCQKIEARCNHCRLPVNHQGRQLSDGRYLCPADFQSAVLDEREGLRIYDSIIDGTRLRQLRQALPSSHEEATVMGLTRSRVRNRTEFEHEIFLINGLIPSRLASVAAHEYTHAWIHENVPTTRRLEGVAVEGFCELVAYKLMARRGEELEKKVILANAYTRGQVNAFVQAENAQQFDRVVKWMKTGVDDSMVATNRSQILVMRPEPSESPWPPPAARETPVPGHLVLRGISGPPSRRLALINHGTLGAGEQGRIRVGQTNILVRCLEVRSNSVLVHVESHERPVELFLAPASRAASTSAPARPSARPRLAGESAPHP
jgi:hypothetical protein